MKTRTYIVFKTDGTKQKIESHRRLQLAQIQKLVGGYIERTRISYDRKSTEAWVNEDGLLLRLPTNPYYPKLVGNIVLELK